MKELECVGCNLCTDKVELFKNLSTHLKRKVSSMASHKKVSKGDVILREGDSLDWFLIIREGRVKLSNYDAEGRELILDILVPGNILGGDGLTKNIKSTSDVIALTDVLYCSIKKQEIEELIKKDAEFAMAIIANLSERIELANERIRNLMEVDALKKVGAFILSRSERLETNNLTLGNEDIAFSLNIRRETVSRKINQLIDEGILLKEGHRNIKIIDKEKLLKRVI